MILDYKVAPMLSAVEFFKAHHIVDGNKVTPRSYGLKKRPDLLEPVPHLTYMELAEDYADYVCRYEKYFGASDSRKLEERITVMSPEKYEKDLLLKYPI